MSYNYGLTGLATIVSGSAQTISADSLPGSAIRIFDIVLLDTSATISLYAGTSSAAANLRLAVNVNTPIIQSDAGFRFVGGVYQSTSATAGNIAIVNYIKEY